ncbi:hypothetical protein Ancab_029616 [Ancistrocladus abbreviatus]
MVNDTVGTLGEGIYRDKDCVAGVIFGTGTNAAYVECKAMFPKLQDSDPNREYMIINMEWGNFQSDSLPRTEYDQELDEKSTHPKEQIFEKMISGKYLGDIVRRVLLKMAQAQFFGQAVPEELTKEFIVGTDVVSAMHEDTSVDLHRVGQTLIDVFKGKAMEGTCMENETGLIKKRKKDESLALSPIA